MSQTQRVSSVPLVKVCGLTRSTDALLAASLGAWALGFVFAESPRRIGIDQARAIVREVKARSADVPSGGDGLGPRFAGVFRDAAPERVAETVAEVGLDAVQLHGSESPEDVVRLRALLGTDAGERPVLVIKALGVAPGPAEGAAPSGPVGADTTAERAAAFRPVVDLLLLDTCASGRSGGTGVAFPWEAARPAAARGPVLVAGGLRPETAVPALRLSGAAGVDLSSGVESAPGVKDETALRRLFAELARLAEEEQDR